MRLSGFVPVLAALLPAVHSLSSTDSPQDGDALQSGYSPNHNFDPATLSSYQLRWKFSTGTVSEFFYAKPLVYTPIEASYERIYIVSDMNIVRVLDGLTGNLLLSRTLEPPFQSSDTQCGDIPNQVGIIGTPIIDSATEIMYFWSKSYRNGQIGPLGTPTTGADNSNTGVANGSLQPRVLLVYMH
jgi:iron transport multicopper oxidase